MPLGVTNHHHWATARTPRGAGFSYCTHLLRPTAHLSAPIWGQLRLLRPIRFERRGLRFRLVSRPVLAPLGALMNPDPKFDPIESRLSETYPFDIDEVPPTSFKPSSAEVVPTT